MFAAMASEDHADVLKLRAAVSALPCDLRPATCDPRLPVRTLLRPGHHMLQATEGGMPIPGHLDRAKAIAGTH